MWWQRLIGINRPRSRETAEINIWRLQSLFNNFRRILFLNNAILEDMDHMERALGGEYIFDRAFLETSVRTIASRVHHVTYNLNALTGNGYIPLYDRYQDVRTILDDILSGNTGALAHSPVLPLHAVGWELEPLVGIDLVCLAELRHHRESRVTEGFVITAEGAQALTGQKTTPVTPEHQAAHVSMTEVRAEIGEQFKTLLKTRSVLRFSVVVTRIEGEEELVQELGRFVLAPVADGPGMEILIESWPEGQSSISMPEAQKNVEPLPASDDSAADLYARCLEHLIRTIFAWFAKSGREPIGPFAVFVRGSLPAAVSGTVQTRFAAKGFPETLSVTAGLPDADAGDDTFLLRRTYPFDIIQSTITPRPAGYHFPEGSLATGAASTHGSFGRGSALVEIKVLKRLAETAMMLERMLGAPVTVRWECLADGECCITGLTPMPVRLEETGGDGPLREQEAEVLCRGGHLVQSGIAAGTVVHVTGEMLPADFPAGAVAVARVASPQLTPVLQRAAAIITEKGTTTGHLATVARELRLPALFGLPDALALLPPGTEVTVDASETAVYRGILETLLRQGAREMDLSPSDPEYRTLRRLLRFIRPLNLIDPEAPNFSPQGCRTFHDIIHFCHEKAVDELAHFQERRPGLGAIRTRRMDLGVPMDIRILDIGGGMAAEGGRELSPDATRSEPFSVFLEGLLKPQAWTTELPTLGLRDIFSSVPRSMGMLSDPIGNLGENLAIVSHDYMNISLRLGYHFSVIDANLGTDDARNYVYFRFAGGLADPERRNRRARFISYVLKAMDFSVSVKGDLVIGKLKMVESAALRSALSVLGALTAFSRQRDTSLYNDADMQILFTIFADTFLGAFNRNIPAAKNPQAPDPLAASGFTGAGGYRRSLPSR